eukprot:8555887-Pyramimonas_sp.AAC.1
MFLASRRRFTATAGPAPVLVSGWTPGRKPVIGFRRIGALQKGLRHRVIEQFTLLPRRMAAEAGRRPDAQLCPLGRLRPSGPMWPRQRLQPW